MADVKLKRNTFIGGSDVAAILGINPYKTAYEVWEEKKHGIKTFDGNNATEWGQKLEPIIVDNCSQINKFDIGYRNDKFVSKVNPILGCHPDGISITPKPKLIEAKTVSSKAYKNWQNELPLEYFCQVQHNMFCCDLEEAIFICLVLDDRYYFEINVNRDNDFIEKQNAYLTEWWNKYIVGDEIPIKIVADYERQFPDQKIVEADESIFKIYQQLVEAKKEFTEAKEKKEALEDQLKLFIGENTDLMYGLNTLATWRTQVRVQIDTKKFKEELPETYLKYCKDNKIRVFLPKI